MRQFTSLIYTRTLFGKEEWYKDRNKKEVTSWRIWPEYSKLALWMFLGVGCGSLYEPGPGYAKPWRKEVWKRRGGGGWREEVVEREIRKRKKTTRNKKESRGERKDRPCREGWKAERKEAATRVYHTLRLGNSTNSTTTRERQRV